MGEKQYLCLGEIQDASLRQELASYRDPGRCDFCGSTPGEGVVDFGDFLEEVMSAVRWAYERASDAAVLFEDGDWLAPTMTLPDIIREILGESDAVTASVAIVAEEYDDGNAWVRRDYPWPTAEHALYQGWDDFCAAVDASGLSVLETGSTGQSLEFRKYGPREMLDVIYHVARRTGRIVPLGADTTLWRSRVSAEPIECTAAALGPAPSDRAAANRMSGARVSMFYGAEDALTAQCEVSAHHAGSSQVSVATCRFSLLRDVWILDLVDLEPVPSIFDRRERELRPFYDFMHHFVEQVGRPLDPDDAEASGYAYTQIFTHYLRHDTSLVRGIRFQSVQAQGVNCVLFVGPEECTDPPAQPQDHLLVLEPGTFMSGPAAMPA